MDFFHYIKSKETTKCKKKKQRASTVFKDLHTVMVEKVLHYIYLYLLTAAFGLLLLIVQLIYQVKEHVVCSEIRHEGDRRAVVFVRHGAIVAFTTDTVIQH